MKRSENECNFSFKFFIVVCGSLVDLLIYCDSSLHVEE